MAVNFVKASFPAGDVDEQRFSLGVGPGAAPGLVVLPREADGLLPLVFIQHPATSSKDDYFVRDVALMWARHGWACAGLDAPLHGERAVFDPMALMRDPDRFAQLAAQFAREVEEAIDAIAEAFPVDVARIGYVGYSLGSMLGLVVLATTRRFRTAALCLIGEGGLVGAADAVGSPVGKLDGVAVRVVGKTGDEFFSKAATEALFDALPGPDKDLLWLPGGHFEIGPDVIKAAEQWMLRTL